MRTETRSGSVCVEMLQGVRCSARRYRMIGSVLSVITLAGCVFPGHVDVATMQAPGATFTTQRSFRILPMLQDRAIQSNAATADDPMLENSITGREVRQDIAQALVSRGYLRRRDSADLAIAYYIGSRTSLVVTDYDYGYPFSDWKMPNTSTGQIATSESEYKQGTVIVDVLDGAARRVLWRGVGQSDVPSDPNHYARALSKAVGAVIARFPGRAAESSVSSR